MGSERITQAVILAGGRGERLRPLTDTLPKPMVPIHGRPFLEYLIELLKQNGIEEVVLLVGYLSEKIIDYFGDGSRFGVHIKYSKGDSDDETGTRIKNAHDMLREKFLLLYGDNYWPLNLSALADFYRFKNVLALTTVYANMDGGGEYGFENNIHLASDGLVLGYDKTRKNPALNGVDIGFFVIDKKVLNKMPQTNFSFEKEILPMLVSEKQLVGYRAFHPYYTLTSADMIPRLEKFFHPKKVVFLDRDGVINKQMPRGDYVKKPEEFELLPGAVDALKRLYAAGYAIFVVTNQRGIALGTMTEDDLRAVHELMRQKLAEQGVSLAGIYYCPHPEGACECRKPKPGMLFRAARDHALDLTKAIMIGDSESDRLAGLAAGCKTIILSPSQTLSDAVETILAGESAVLSSRGMYV